MKVNTKHWIALFGTMMVIAVTPTSAFAGGSVHLDVPGFSIGIHDDHKYRNRHRRSHRSRHYDSYYNDRRYERRSNRYRTNRYRNRNYYNDYYSSGRNYNNNYNRRYDRRYDRGYNNGYSRGYNDRRAEVCPLDGYSASYDRNRNCYEHKGHYHCS